MKRLISGLALPAAALACLAPVRALGWTGPEAAAGRALVSRYADCIVNVEVVTSIKVTLGQSTLPPQEPRMLTNGTVISPTGLTIASLTQIDPRATIEGRLRGALGANLQRLGGLSIGEAEYKEAKIRLADGTEIAARVVLKDPDLDLAFLAPNPGAAPAGWPNVYAHLDSAAAPELLSDYYVVSREPKALQRAPLVRLVTIEAIADRPRQLFVINGATVGCPVLDPRGAVLGICLNHVANGRPGGVLVLPAADVAQGAKLAAAAALKPPPETGAEESSAASGPPIEAAPPASADEPPP